MTIRQRLLSWVVKLSSGLLYLRVKSTLAPKPVEDLKLDSEKPVFYVTRYRSFTDALVLHRECKIHNLPLPFTATTTRHSGSSGKTKRLNSNAVIHLTRPGITEISSKSPRYFSDKLNDLVEQALLDPNFDVQLVPASVFWGRSPRSEGSFWQAAFSDSWSVPGFFRKFLMVLTKGRQTYVQLSAPFSLQQILEKENELQRGLAKTHRLIRRRMRMQREAFIGPDLSHRRTLLLSILDTPKVKSIIQKQAASQSTSIEKVHKQAMSYANEIAADYSHSVIRAMHVLLKWLWTKLYNGVQIHGGPALQKLAQENAIVYVPSHRSHMDYLLMSFVLYDSLELVPPHIAAGVNLNLPVIGPILRRGGAFFMRRSFKDNPLYAAVFSEYLRKVLERGFSIEYFIEGGRSRTGRQLPPKPGMLSMTLDSYSTTSQRSLVFVPVNFCYERLFEGKSYLGELRGKKKRKETLTQFIKSLRRIKENFGQVHVTFGEPIPAKEFLLSQGLAKGTQFSALKYAEQKRVALALGHHISSSINNCAYIHPVALVSIALQATPLHAIEEEVLLSHLDISRAVFKNERQKNAHLITNLPAEELLTYCETLDYVCRYPNQFGDIIFATEKQSQYLSYFRNNVIHFFALPSLLALLKFNGRTLSNDKLMDQALELYPFIQAELFLHWSIEEVSSQLKQTLIQLDDMGVTGPSQQRSLELLGGIVRPSLERLGIVLTLLQRSGTNTTTPKELESQARIHAERVSKLYQVNAPEYFDAKLFHSLVEQLLNSEIVTLNEEGNLVFGKELLAAANQTEAILGSELSQRLWAQST